MSKYCPLREYLRQQTAAEIALSFSEIEGIIGASLPASSYAPHWWASAGAPHPCAHRAAWWAAGYGACLIRGSDRVIFRRQG